MKNLLYLLLLLPFLSCAQTKFGVEGIPMCWTIGSVDSNIIRYVLISSTGKPTKTIAYENAAGQVVNVSGGVLKHGFCGCDTLDNGVVTWEKLAEAVKDSVRGRKDTTVVVLSENKVVDFDFADTKRFANVYFVGKGVTDTAQLIFLNPPAPEQFGTVFHMKADSGGVAVKFNASQGANNKNGYFLQPGQRAEIRALYDAVAGFELWEVVVQQDTVALDRITAAIGGNYTRVVATPTTLNILSDLGGYPLLRTSPVLGANRKNIQVWNNGVPVWENRYASDSVKSFLALKFLHAGYLEIDPSTSSPSFTYRGNSISTNKVSTFLRLRNTGSSGASSNGNITISANNYGVNSANDISFTFSSSTQRISGTYISRADLGVSFAQGTKENLLRLYLDSTGLQYSSLYAKTDSLNIGGRYHNAGFAKKIRTSSIGNNGIGATTSSFLVQTHFYNVSAKFDWFLIDNLDADTTGDRLTMYNKKYAFANARPSTTSGAISTHIWTGTTPSFLRSQHAVLSGTTDPSGDLTVTFAAAMPDATYTVLALNEGTTAYILSAHTKAAGSVKIRVFDAAGVAAASTSVTISYEVKDN